MCTNYTVMFTLLFTIGSYIGWHYHFTEVVRDIERKSAIKTTTEEVTTTKRKGKKHRLLSQIFSDVLTVPADIVTQSKNTPRFKEFLRPKNKRIDPLNALLTEPDDVTEKTDDVAFYDPPSRTKKVKRQKFQFMSEVDTSTQPTYGRLRLLRDRDNIAVEEEFVNEMEKRKKQRDEYLLKRCHNDLVRH